MAKRTAVLAPITAILSVILLTPSARALKTVRIMTGLDQPTYLCSPPGDYHRLFVLEQTGAIRIIKDSVLLTRPFLDVDALSSCCNERGLLGLAFHPNYAGNGFFYIDYTNNVGNTVIARYTVSADADSANPSTALILKTITQPESNHNGGCLQFGPDGKLYVGMGDGGGANDQHGTIGNGQNGNTLLGKILRLDVDLPSPYIPVDNPFVGAVDTMHEIWAIGMRNPWRFSFDRLTGDLYIGDVGQDSREEIDFQLASSTGGENYGWRCMEGTFCTGMTGCTCNAGNLTLPISEYVNGSGCYAVTGGYVYRGCAIPSLQGTYFYADYCRLNIWSWRYNGTSKSDSTERTTELDPPGAQAINAISSFGEDAFGEIYVCDLGDGEIYKIVPDSYADCDSNKISDSCEIAVGMAADANGNGIPDGCDVVCSCTCHADPACDGVPDVLDVVSVIASAFRGGSPQIDPGCTEIDRSDVNCDCVVDILDVVAMVNHAFRDDETPFCNACTQPCP